MPELHGWIFDDEIIAGESNTTPFQIYGHEGNDRLSGGNGSDLIDGGTGADEMLGWLGNDTYVVDNIGDTIIEADLHYGAADYDEEALAHYSFRDTVYASISFTLPDARDLETFGNIVINGVENLSLLTNAGAINGTGNELGNVIHGNGSNNTLEGRDGHDLIIGHGGSDTLRGGSHNDELYGSEDNDTLEGGAGSDTLDGGTGADEMRGGSSDDYYFVDNTGDTVIEQTSPGIDTVYSTITFTLGANVEDLVLQSGAGAIDGTGNALDNTIGGNESDNELRGNDGEDLLKGGGGADVLRGGNQNDEMYGQGGADELRGDGGDDEMYGGTNDDTYWVGSAGDEVIEFTAEGTDTVNSSVDDYTLTANVENLTLATGVNGTGNNLQNRIIGNILGNTLDGAGGADTMEGRQGDDTYRVDNANDVVVEATNQGNDTVLASVNYTLTANTSVETLATTNDAGTAAINLTGNGIANAIRGNNGGNILNGGGGADGIDGRGGIDTASYENNAWRVIVVLGVNGAPGQGYEFGIVPPGQEVLLSVDTLINIENVRGSAFNDMLVGNEAVNELRGGGGGDTYVVQNAGDTIVEFAGQGTDEVRAAVSYTLTAGADVETLRTTDDNGTAAIDLTGNTSGNNITGNNGDNTLNGGGGSDGFTGRDGDDTYIVDSITDTITENGGQGIDTVLSSATYTLTAGADVETLATNNDAGTAAINLTGNANGNEVRGNNGNNILNGGDGRDDLIGLGGQDSFLFNTAPNAATNHDRIIDFNLIDDAIVLENAVFTAFAAGGLAAERFFVVGTGTQDANDNIVYNRATGELFYDSDGAGGTTAILFAEVTPNLNLSASDFLIQ